MIVFARRLPVNDVLARADEGVATGGATGADAFGLLQKPNPHLETEIGGRERADWTEIDRVERVIIFETSARVRGQNSVTAAIDESEDVVIGNFVAKSNASRTKNAAFVIERNARSELHRLRFFNFVFEKTRTGRPVLDTEFLQLALARLVADRTIERMIDQQKFHHAFAAFLN